MSDTTPRPGDEPEPVPPVAGGGPAEPPAVPPVPPAAPSDPPPAAPPVPPSQPPYGAPAAGGYPPPAGDYPPPAYNAPLTAQSPIGEAISWGWNKFTKNGGIFVGAGLLWLLIGVAVYLVVIALVGGFSAIAPTNSDGSVQAGIGFGFSVALIVVGAALSLLAALVQAVFVRASLRVTYGQRVGLKDFFDFSNAGPILVAVLLIWAINVVVSLVSWIPVLGWAVAIVVNIFVFFTLYFVIDKQLGAVDGLKASIALVRANFGSTILFLLLCYAILFVGALLCGIGLVVAVPVVLLAAAYFYRRLNGEPVAA